MLPAAGARNRQPAKLQTKYDHASAIAFARTEISARRKGDDFQSQARAVNQKLGSRSKQPKRMVARKKDQTQLAFDL